MGGTEKVSCHTSLQELYSVLEAKSLLSYCVAEAPSRVCRLTKRQVMKTIKVLLRVCVMKALMGQSVAGVCVCVDLND